MVDSISINSIDVYIAAQGTGTNREITRVHTEARIKLKKKKCASQKFWFSISKPYKRPNDLIVLVNS